MKTSSLLLFALLVACGDSHDGTEDAGRLDSGGEDAGSDGSIVDGSPDTGMLRDGEIPVDAALDAPPSRGCTSPTDCVLVPRSCCGACGEPSRTDSIALHRDDVNAFRNGVCGDDVGCPACAGQPDPTLLASCVSGQCAVIDLYVHPSTECMRDDDCRVRAIDCCECGADTSPGRLIAVSRGYDELVCDPMSACPECAPVYPDTVFALCNDGHCRLAEE